MKNNNNQDRGAGNGDGPVKTQHLYLFHWNNSSLVAAILPETLYVDGVEPMNLASLSGDAGGSQLLFANFNQDNT